ncbi:hypothetical protein TYRP_016816 [Tyrophagus putrescentiae]|nr:hypothetical protein TYRP_016816 [Tyrophagus putrescentiae]
MCSATARQTNSAKPKATKTGAAFLSVFDVLLVVVMVVGAMVVGALVVGVMGVMVVIEEGVMVLEVNVVGSMGVIVVMGEGVMVSILNGLEVMVVVDEVMVVGRSAVADLSKQTIPSVTTDHAAIRQKGRRRRPQWRWWGRWRRTTTTTATTTAPSNSSLVEGAIAGVDLNSGRLGGRRNDATILIVRFVVAHRALLCIAGHVPGITGVVPIRVHAHSIGLHAVIARVIAVPVRVGCRRVVVVVSGVFQA